MTKRSISHATFVLERRFPASAARVYQALADPATKAKWFVPPEAWDKETHQMDFRIGGVETSIGGPVGGPVHKFVAVYQDIVPNERIIYSYHMTLDDLRISVSVATFEIIPEGEHTQLRLTEMGAYLDGFDDGGKLREEGTSGLLDGLGAFLARTAAN